MKSRRATAIAIVTLLTGALSVAGCGGSSSHSDGNSSKSAKPRSTKSSTTCSASGIDVTWKAPAGVPAPVAATARELFDAARACDFQRLGAAALSSPDFAYSYGKEPDPVAYWQRIDAKQQTMRRLAELLSGAHVIKHEGPAVYAWPAAYTDAPKPSAWADLVKTGAYSASEVHAFQRDASYSGYRIAIKPDGSWSYFLTGD